MGPVLTVRDSSNVVGVYAMAIAWRVVGAQARAGRLAEPHRVDRSARAREQRRVRVPLPYLLIAVALCSACAHHVVLDRPPPPTAPLEQRRSWFDQHALAKAQRGELVVRQRLFGEHPTVARQRATLKNGLTIERVEDLRPLVPDHSAAAQAMDLAVDARARADGFTAAGAGVAGVGVLVGGALVATDLGVFPGTAQVPTQEVVAPPLIIGGIAAAAVGATVGGVLIAVGTAARDEEDDATTAAFAAYDADLRRALALDAAP